MLSNINKPLLFYVQSRKYIRCILAGSIGIAPTFLKLESLSPWAGFILLYSPREVVGKKLSLMHTKRFNTFLKYHVYPIGNIWKRILLMLLKILIDYCK